MQQFVVPQFIDVEAKIIGPITARQFIILLGATLLIALFYRIFDFGLFLATGIPVLIIAAIFAFIKVNGRPFHFFVLNIIQTGRRPNMRVWDHKAVAIEQEGKVEKVKQDYIVSPKRAYGQSRLAELSLVVDTTGKYKGERKQ